MNEPRKTIWEQLVEKKAKWIGGTLTDTDLHCAPDSCVSTTITDMTFEDNFFKIHGEDFNCGFNIRYGGISGGTKDNGMRFLAVGGLDFSIAEKVPL